MNIIVTGAGKGIGFETVIKLLECGGNSVLAVSRSIEQLEQLKKSTTGSEKKLFVDSTLDILNFDILNEDVTELSTFLKDATRHVDVLINNAGILINKAFLDCKPAEFSSMMETNFIGHIRMIQAVIPFFNPQKAHIVNIGSMGGYQGSLKFKGLSAYSASKAALMNLTESLAGELKEKNIKVNALALGAAQTEMLSKAFPNYTAPVTAKEMASFIADFALTGQQFFNGKILPVALSSP